MLVWLALLFLLAECQLTRKFGVNIHFTNAQAGVMQQLAAGFKITRMDFTWAGIEKTAGVYDFSNYDNLLSQLKAQNVSAYWILDYDNPLYDGGLSPYTDTGRSAFANFTVAAMQHFKGQQIIWELWNEPNGGFWKPTPNPVDYASLAVTVGQAIAANGLQSETFIGPALSGFDWNYFQTIFENGVLKYFDYVSVHPYRDGGPETVTADYQKLASMIVEYNPSTPQKIISGEWGWTTCGPCVPDYNNAEPNVTQAKFLARQWLMNSLNDIDVSIYYDWMDDGTDQTNPEDRFGSVTNAYINSTLPHFPKPSYTAATVFQSILPSNLYSFYTRVTASVNGQADDNTYALAFSNGATKAAAYAVWKTDLSQTCAQSASLPRTDCGYYGIDSTDCTNRGCCFESPYVGPGAQCYLPYTSATVTFSATNSGSACFKVTSYDGTLVSSQLCPNAQGIFTVTASDGPIYLS